MPSSDARSIALATLTAGRLHETASGLREDVCLLFLKFIGLPLSCVLRFDLAVLPRKHAYKSLSIIHLLSGLLQLDDVAIT